MKSLQKNTTRQEVHLKSDMELRIREAAKRLLDEGIVEYVIGWENTRFPNKQNLHLLKNLKIHQNLYGINTV